MTTPTTVHGALAAVARSHPDVTAHFPSDHESVTYHELAGSAWAMAAGLIDRGIRPGDRVGVLCPNAPEFLRSLFAINAAGAAACPLPLPFGLRDMDSYPQRLARIAAVAGMRRILVSHRFALLAERLGGAVPGVELWPTDDPWTAGAALPEVSGADVALVQFTSGSTALPKGVRLTHRNVLAGLAAIREGIALGSDDGGGFWLPLFHDMGLFGTLSAVLKGIPVHVWSPISFVKDPGRWLREFLASGATITAMPNFGYDQLLDAVPPEQAATLSMAHWRIAFNGAEPIAEHSVAAFLARFAPAGLRPETMFTVYGMAEATLAVTFPPLGRAPLFEHVDRERLTAGTQAVPVPGGRPVAGVGRPVAGIELRVVDLGIGTEVGDGRVGEIEIRGEPVTAGYLSADGSGQSIVDGWLRTGDLGYQRDGELFVTGRLKEMIVIRGANFYPQDVEAVARTVAGIYKGRCAAVAGEEEILLVAETGLKAEAAAALAVELRRRVAAELGLGEITVHLVAPRSIPRTSSGKVQRLATRELVRPRS